MGVHASNAPVVLPAYRSHPVPISRPFIHPPSFGNRFADSRKMDTASVLLARVVVMEESG
ncbi:hypothetical protein [Aneurinibacillus terranovensis]|uniref:hypothetical protein n=1 Tax=Aneurinibacillus terranovensis TaxID=278991 RepID=UPI003CCBA65D